jgi:hypothetical protein
MDGARTYDWLLTNRRPHPRRLQRRGCAKLTCETQAMGQQALVDAGVSMRSSSRVLRQSEDLR